jgi:hypothetical protein
VTVRETKLLGGLKRKKNNLWDHYFIYQGTSLESGLGLSSGEDNFVPTEDMVKKKENEHQQSREFDRIFLVKFYFFFIYSWDFEL